MRKRFDIRRMLVDPIKRKELFTSLIITIQAREGIVTTKEQAEDAYEKALILGNNNLLDVRMFLS